MANFWIMKYFLFVLGSCSFFIVSNLNASISEKQQIFETLDVKKRLNAAIKKINGAR